MNGSILESAISEQLFCNAQVNPTNEPCYGISTVSGLQRAAQQGQKIYQINSKNKAQLANIQMSGEEMANDINRAINSGGYVIVPERAVDGSGRNAIYVYMTYNGQDGHQAWKISGGLNGALFQGFGAGVATALLSIALVMVFAASGFIVLTFLIAVLLILTIFLKYVIMIGYEQEAPELLPCFKLGSDIGELLAGIGTIVATKMSSMPGKFIALLALGYSIEMTDGKQNNEAQC